MASTPSASALSAVLRCRGNILTRNPPNKRPVRQAYSLGLAYEAVRDSTIFSERTASNHQPAASTTTTWRCFLRGERVPRRGKKGSSATVKHPAALEEDEDTSLLRNNTNNRGIKYRCRSHSRFPCTPPEATRSSYVTGAPNAPARVARTLQSTAASGRVESSVVGAAHVVYTIKCVQNVKELPVGVVNVSVILPSWKDNGGQMTVGLLPLFILNGWSTLKNNCLSLSVLVSEMIYFNLGVLSCRPDNNNAREMDEQGKSTVQNDSNVQQVKGHPRDPSDPLKAFSDSRTPSKENRPD